MPQSKNLTRNIIYFLINMKNNALTLKIVVQIISGSDDYKFSLKRLIASGVL